MTGLSTDTFIRVSHEHIFPRPLVGLVVSSVLQFVLGGLEDTHKSELSKSGPGMEDEGWRMKEIGAYVMDSPYF